MSLGAISLGIVQSNVQIPCDQNSRLHDSHGVEGDLIDFQNDAVCIEKPDELDHRIERDAGNFLPILSGGIGGEQRGAADSERGSAGIAPSIRDYGARHANSPRIGTIMVEPRPPQRGRPIIGSTRLSAQL